MKKTKEDAKKEEVKKTKKVEPKAKVKPAAKAAKTPKPVKVKKPAKPKAPVKEKEKAAAPAKAKKVAFTKPEPVKIEPVKIEPVKVETVKPAPLPEPKAVKPPAQPSVPVVPAAPVVPAVKKEPQKIVAKFPMTIKDLAAKINARPNDIIMRLMKLKIMATINQAIDIDAANLISADFGFEFEKPLSQEEEILKAFEVVDKAKMVHRAPVVTLMGHVDHGKTSLLDAIRKSSLTDKES
ncbi:MAG: translation initiation factor IF-2 N-terminal domain-containing protein, partial [Candidatus Omnitrophota bacterium]